MAAPSAHAAFVVTHLGYLSGTTAAYANALNDSGQVVGFMTGPNAQLRAFSYAGGGLTDLGTLSGGAGAIAWGINNAGQIVGESRTASGEQRAFVSAGGAMTGLGTLPGGTRSVAYDINDLGFAVGLSNPAPSSRDRAVSFSGGNVNDLGVLTNGVGGVAQAVNDAGTTVGYTEVRTGSLFNPSYYDRAFVGTQAALGGINTGRLESYATDINDAGVVVGYAGQQEFMVGYVLANGVYQELPSLPTQSPYTFTYARAVNEAGAIVGQSNSRAFLYSSGAMVDLRTQLVNGTGWTSLTQATDINDLGQIVGTGFYNGQQAAFLLTPQVVPLPASAWLLGLGLATFFAARKKRRGAS